MNVLREEQHVAQTGLVFWQEEKLLDHFCGVAENAGWTTPDACQVDAYTYRFHRYLKLLLCPLHRRSMTCSCLAIPVRNTQHQAQENPEIGYKNEGGRAATGRGGWDKGVGEETGKDQRSKISQVCQGNRFSRV